MSFDTPFFLSVFLPVLVLLYCLIPGKPQKNILLLLASLLFCAFGSISGAAVMCIFAAVNFVLGLLLQRFPRKALLTAGVTGNLAFLLFYKYLNFFLPGVFSGGLAVPLGISFFTFKGISYLVDIYRDPTKGTKNFFRFLLYISFFPQITAGPITRFGDFLPQLESRDPSGELMAEGFRRFVFGLGKSCCGAARPRRSRRGCRRSGRGDMGAAVLDLQMKTFPGGHGA